MKALYDEFAEWCEDEAKNLQFEIKTAKAEAEDLGAVIEKAASDIAIEEEEIAKYSGQLASDNSDLKAATAIREKENKIFLLSLLIEIVEACKCGQKSARKIETVATMKSKSFVKL